MTLEKCEIHKVDKDGQFLHCTICGLDWENKLHKTSEIKTKPKRKLFKTRSEIFESILVFGFLLGILFPIRLLFVEYVTDSWIGSLGILSSVYIIIIILIKKNKLGRFGKMIARQLFKIHKGKRRYFVYTNIALSTLFFAMIVYGMETAKTGDYPAEVNKFFMELPQQSLTNPQEAQNYVSTEQPKFTPNRIIQSIIALILLPFTDHNQFIILWGLIDKMTEGWFLNLSIVLLAEQIEVIGFLTAIKFIIREDFFNQKTV